jgi:hypothetical protein
MEHALQVVHYLPRKSKTGRPSPVAVLQAALQVGQIGEYAKERMRKVLEILPKLEEAQAAAPESVKRAVDSLRQELVAKKDIEEKRRLLRDAGTRQRYRDVGGLAEGMEVAAQILEDGRSSIYSPDFSFYRLLEEGKDLSHTAARDAVDNISDADAIGAAAGGIAGAIAGAAGGPAGSATGAQIGAVVIGGGASLGAAIGSFINWILEPVDID